MIHIKKSEKKKKKLYHIQACILPAPSSCLEQGLVPSRISGLACFMDAFSWGERNVFASSSEWKHRLCTKKRNASGGLL